MCSCILGGKMHIEETLPLTYSGSSVIRVCWVRTQGWGRGGGGCGGGWVVLSHWMTGPKFDLIWDTELQSQTVRHVWCSKLAWNRPVLNWSSLCLYACVCGNKCQRQTDPASYYLFLEAEKKRTGPMTLWSDYTLPYLVLFWLVQGQVACFDLLVAFFSVWWSIAALQGRQ